MTFSHPVSPTDDSGMYSCHQRDREDADLFRVCSQKLISAVVSSPRPESGATECTLQNELPDDATAPHGVEAARSAASTFQHCLKL